MSVEVVETRYSHLKFESRQQVLLSDSSSIWERIEPFPSRFIKTLENLEMKRGDLSYFQTNEKKTLLKSKGLKSYSEIFSVHLENLVFKTFCHQQLEDYKILTNY